MNELNQTKTNLEKEYDYWIWDSIERDTEVTPLRVVPSASFIKSVDVSTIIQTSYLTNISSIKKSGQDWYWTEGWQKAEQEVDIALAEGAFMKFSTIDEVISYLHEQTSEE